MKLSSKTGTPIFFFRRLNVSINLQQSKIKVTQEKEILKLFFFSLCFLFLFFFLATILYI